MTLRLPRHITPTEYAAEMIPFIVEDNFTIAGNVDMTFNFSEVRQGSLKTRGKFSWWPAASQHLSPS